MLEAEKKSYDNPSPTPNMNLLFQSVSVPKLGCSGQKGVNLSRERHILHKPNVKHPTVNLNPRPPLPLATAAGGTTGSVESGLNRQRAGPPVEGAGRNEHGHVLGIIGTPQARVETFGSG